MSDKKMVVLGESHKALSKLLETKQEALPKDFNKARFLQNCMTVLQDTKDIDKCQPISVARTMLKGAFLGLDFFNRECYAIPYGGNLQFQTDYKGEIKLAKKYSFNSIKDIYAKIVREGDDFQESIEDGRQTINFKPLPFNNGEIIGAFAVCLFQDGSMLYETMTKQEIEDIRLTFKDGIVVEATASKGQKLLEALIDIDPGARRVGEVAIGTNYNINRFTKNMLFDEKIGGTIHLALGKSYPLSGGRNTSAIHWDMLCDMRDGGEIYADGELFYKDGKVLDKVVR